MTEGTTTSLASAAPMQRELFGHPFGLAYVVVAEGFQFFAYSGAQALLTLYLTKQLFVTGNTENVLGLAAYRAAMEAVFGSMTTIGLASQSFGLFTGLAYALPLFGALLADRWLGQRRVTLGGLALLGAGYALLISDRTFLIGLVLVILATGAFKPNLLGMIGRLYAPDDARATRGYGCYLIGINVGSFASPLICGSLAATMGFGWGFTPLGVAAILAFLVTLAGRHYLPKDTIVARNDGSAAPEKLHASDRRVIAVLLLLLVFDTIYVGTYNQSFDIFPVWADAHVDRTVFGVTLPATLFSSLDGIFTILGTVLSMRLWGWQAKRGRESSDFAKFGIGLLMAGVAFLILAFGATMQPKTPILFPIIYFALIDTAITWVDLLLLSIIARASPPAIASTMLSLYLLSTMFSNFLVGWLGTYYDGMSGPAFWGMHAVIVLSVVPLLLVSRRFITRTLPSQGAGETR